MLEIDGGEISCRVGPDVARDQRRADDPAMGVHEEPDLVRPAPHPGRWRLAGTGCPFGQRLVRPLTHRRDVDPEEQVAHRAVGHDDGLVDLVAIDAMLQVEVAQLVVQRPSESEAHRPGEVLLIRDAGHHVAAAEALRVLERASGDGAAGQQVDELEDDGRGADIDRQSEDMRSPGVDRLARVADGHVVGGDGRVGHRRHDARRSENPHPPPDDRELDVLADILDGRLAGQTELTRQVGFGRRPRRETLGALPHLDDAFAATARAPARRRDGRGDLIRVLEQRPTDDQGPALSSVDDVGHSGLQLERKDARHRDAAGCREGLSHAGSGSANVTAWRGSGCRASGPRARVRRRPASRAAVRNPAAPARSWHAA